MKLIIQIFIIICITTNVSHTSNISFHKDYQRNLLKGNQEMIFCFEYWNQDQINYTRKNNLKPAYIIYQDVFIKGKSIDYSGLTIFIDKFIQDKNSKEIGILDYEGDDYLVLIGDKVVTNVEYEIVLKKYRDLLKFVKNIRPNMKWSYFGINATGSPTITNNRINFNRRMLPLLNELDFLAPCIYLEKIYDGSNNNSNYIISNLKESLDLAKKLNKNVYPFIWHRYHNSMEDNSLIENESFVNYLNTLANFNQNNLTISGVLWWNCETYIQSKKNKTFKLEKEFRNKGKDYQINVFNNYIKYLKSNEQ